MKNTGVFLPSLSEDWRENIRLGILQHSLASFPWLCKLGMPVTPQELRHQAPRLLQELPGDPLSTVQFPQTQPLATSWLVLICKSMCFRFSVWQGMLWSHAICGLAGWLLALAHWPISGSYARAVCWDMELWPKTFTSHSSLVNAG